MRENEAANLKRAERLRQAILKRAFEGKLVAQDPEDEPAGVLLQRIRAGEGVSNGKVIHRRNATGQSPPAIVDTEQLPGKYEQSAFLLPEQ